MAASNAVLNNRDVFLGERRCVICGIADPESLQRCNIVGSDDGRWSLLERLGWTPAGAKSSPKHERNALLMCANHHRDFKDHKFFIRFQPATKQYIFVHYDSYCAARSLLDQYHGKAIALNIEDMYAPLPLLFLVHEHMARGKNFLQPTPYVEVTNSWQRWMVIGGVVNEEDDGAFTFNREATTSLSPPPGQSSSHLQASESSTTAQPFGSQSVIMPPTDDLVEELLAYQRTTPSWKAWQREIMVGKEQRKRT